MIRLEHPADCRCPICRAGDEALRRLLDPKPPPLPVDTGRTRSNFPRRP